MRILFDQNVPRGLAKYLAEHEVMRASDLDWEQLKNGELLKAAEDHRFEVLPSCDRKLAYQQQVDGRRISILVLSTNN